MTLQCRFYPQAWVNDNVIDVDAEGETHFTVPWPDSEPIPNDNSYKSDNLRFNDNVPEWIREWHGPFYVEILNREEATC
jgi:hypothetical protein